MQQFYANGRAMPRKMDVRQVADDPSKQSRDLFDTCSGAVWEVFECCSGSTRTTPEAHPKEYRRCPEPVPKRTRSASEGHPNSTRRNRWVSCRFLGTLKARIKYRCSKDIVLFTQLLRKIAELPLMYRECTVSVRGVYRKGTREVLERYWRPTKDPLNTCTSGVDQRYSNRVEAVKNKVTLCLTGLLCFMLFNLSTAWAQSAESRAAEGQISDTTGHRIIPFSKEAVIKRIRANPKYNLATYPLQNYEIDRKIISGISLGQSIPEEVWDMPLRTVRADGSEDTCTLSAFNNDKFLILDFWTTWCQPCVASVNKWERIVSKVPDKVQLVNLHLGFDYQAPPFISDRGWSSSTVIGMGSHLLNAYFFTTAAFGKIVWIKSGKLYAITTASQLSEEELEAIVMGNGKVQSTTEGVYSN